MLKRKNDNILVRFNKSFYDEEMITKSISDFGKTFDIKLKKDDKYFEVTIKDYDKNKIAAMEFCNYVLGMMKLENRKV